MESQTDLRSYLAVLLHHWKWIVGLGVVAAVVAFGVSSLQPRIYEASTVILVMEPRYQLQFDPRFETEAREPAYKAFPTLAESDGIMENVTRSYTPSADADIEDWSYSTLSGMVDATSAGDPSLVLLNVRSRSPEDAAALANTWADIVAERGNALYGGSEQDVAFLEEQLASARVALGETERNLIEFESRDYGVILQAQLDAMQETLADYLATERTIGYLLQDIHGLRTQLAEQPASQPASLADNLTALLLQIKAFNAQTHTEEGITPLQLQIDDSTFLSDKSLTEQIAFLDHLLTTLDVKSTEIGGLQSELEPQLLEVQTLLQETNVERDRLTDARDLTRDTYQTLARKLEEARISAQEKNSTLQVGSYAVVPGNPVSPRRFFNTVVAAFLGLLAGCLIVLAVDFWRQGKEHVDQEQD